MSPKTVQMTGKDCAQKLLSIRAYLLKLVRLEEADARKCAARIYRVALRLGVAPKRPDMLRLEIAS